jgi:hypothetical protein
MLVSIAVVIDRAAHGPIERRPFYRKECCGFRCRDIFQMDSWFALAERGLRCRLSRKAVCHRGERPEHCESRAAP